MEEKKEFLYNQLIELDNEIIEDGMTHFFCSLYNWKEDVLDEVMSFLLEKNEDYYLECYSIMCNKLVDEVSEEQLVEYFDIEGTPYFKKERELRKLETLLDEQKFHHSRYEEDGICVGIEFEDWTEGGVDMIYFIDGRDEDMTEENWYYHKLQDIYETFDVDDEIDKHRQDESYKRQFSIRESLEDFE